MKYKMYEEMIVQGKAIRETFKSELSKMKDISKLVAEVDTIYLVGCGSSISTCYSVRDALSMVSSLNVKVFTGYEFTFNKKLTIGENSLLICSSQSGETGDTLAALKRANKFNIPTVSISNEEDSSMIKEAKYPIITKGGKEFAILGTKTYVTQLASLYQILFGGSDYENRDQLLNDLAKVPDIIDELIKSTEEEGKKLAKEFANEDIFYCLGSGPNFGLSYKLAMTMLMEGAIKHACPLYAGEFRHGLIERAEKDVPLIFFDSDFDSDKITRKAIEFSKTIGAKTIVYNLKDYADINKLLSPLIFVVPIEWFIYYLAHFNGEDPGSTRHIGKVRYD